MLRWSKGNKEGEQAPAADAAPASIPRRAEPEYTPAGDVAPALNLTQLLVAEGKVSKEQIQAALDRQKKTGQFIGEILIEDKVLEEHMLISFLAKHCKIPHLSLLDYLIDKDIVGLVPKEICLTYRLLPIDRLGKNLTVAMVNPLDTEALERVRAACPDLRIKPILCAYKHFELVTEKLFREDGAGGGAQLMSASSFGLKLTPAEKARVEVQREQMRADHAAYVAAAAPPPPPEPEPIPEPVYIPEPEPEPVYVPEPEPTYEVPAPEPEYVAPPITPAEPHVGSDSMFESIFSSGSDEAPAPAAQVEQHAEAVDDGGMSALMQEMATVMMDSMRDTYGVLARRMDLFRGLDGESVAKIFARGISEEFEEGDIVFHKGDPGDCLYLILGGSVDIFDGDRVMARLERGALFGEMALISKEPRSASARAAESASLLALSLDTINHDMPREVSIQLLVNIIVTMGNRLRAANEQS